MDDLVIKKSLEFYNLSNDNVNKFIDDFTVLIVNSPYFYIELGRNVISLTTDTSLIYNLTRLDIFSGSTVEKKFNFPYVSYDKIVNPKKDLFPWENSSSILLERIIPEIPEDWIKHVPDLDFLKDYYYEGLNYINFLKNNNVNYELEESFYRLKNIEYPYSISKLLINK